MKSKVSDKLPASKRTLGSLKMLKPFVFTDPKEWSDGFNEHGIWEIAGKKVIDGKVKCTIRRIATYLSKCKLGEERMVWEKVLEDYTTPTTWSSFKVDPLKKEKENNIDEMRDALTQVKIDHINKHIKLPQETLAMVCNALKQPTKQHELGGVILTPPEVVESI